MTRTMRKAVVALMVVLLSGLFAGSVWAVHISSVGYEVFSDASLSIPFDPNNITSEYVYFQYHVVLQNVDPPGTGIQSFTLQLYDGDYDQASIFDFDWSSFGGGFIDLPTGWNSMWIDAPYQLLIAYNDSGVEITDAYFAVMYKVSDWGEFFNPDNWAYDSLYRQHYKTQDNSNPDPDYGQDVYSGTTTPEPTSLLLLGASLLGLAAFTRRKR